MDHRITAEIDEFMRWLERNDCEHYWEKDEKGEKVILRSGWGKAEQDNDEIKG